jgi:hypothetical protein
VQEEEKGPLITARRSALTLFASLAFALALLPAASRAETRTFLDTTSLFPTGGALTEGPANEYPSSIGVSGLSGTVTKVTVTLVGFDSTSPDDIDAAIVGPNGQQVMLISDACGHTDSHKFEGNSWTFDDAASTFVSSVGCSSFQEASFRPSNYGDPADDDLSVNGGPAGPYLNSLSLLAGGTPNGAWKLFVFDDSSSYHGFDISAWALHLEIQPPPPATQGNTPTTSGTAAVPVTVKKCKKKKPGKKAAAAKKCKKKKKR